MKALTDASAARLRRPAAQVGRALRPRAGGARALRAPLPLRDGRRVPGHQPAAVPAGQAAGQRPRQPVRGRRPRPVDLQVARRRPAQHPRLRARLPRRRHRQARAQLSLDAGDPRRGVGGGAQQPRPQGQGALDRPDRRRADCHLSAAPTSSTRPTSSCGWCAGGLADDADSTAAVLYRTNAQSRAVEDGLRQAGIPYAVLGGTASTSARRSRTRSAYLKLVLNPHDDVALRRVINMPPRGIGKGVMDALEQRRSHGARTSTRRRCSPASPPSKPPTSLWAKLDAAVTRGLLAPRQLSAARRLSRDAPRGHRRPPRQAGVHGARHCCSIAAATCATCARSAARRPTAASRT